MTDTNTEIVDVDSMSMEELDSHMSELEGKPAPEKVETEEKPDVDATKTEETEPEAQTPQSEETPKEEPTDKTPSDEVLDGEDVEPQYRGKTTKELLEMQRNANKKISQQNNEIYHWKKKAEESAEVQKQKTETLKQETEDDLLARYEEEDIKAINKLVDKAFQKKEAAKAEKVTAMQEQAVAEHEGMWENLQVFNPELYSQIKEEALAAMRTDYENTYQKKGWMKQFITERATKGSKQPKPNATLETKKRATTITGGAQPSSHVSKKSTEDMTEVEYEKHMNAQGIKF